MLLAPSPISLQIVAENPCEPSRYAEIMPVDSSNNADSNGRKVIALRMFPSTSSPMALEDQVTEQQHGAREPRAAARTDAAARHIPVLPLCQRLVRTAGLEPAHPFG